MSARPLFALTLALVLGGSAGTVAAQNVDRANVGAERLEARLDAIDAGLDRIEREAAAGRADALRRTATRVYLDEYEPIEALYGAPGAPLAEPVAAAENAFHRLMVATPDEAPALVQAARGSLAEIRRRADETGSAAVDPVVAVEPPAAVEGTEAVRARTDEFAVILAELDLAEAAWRAGDRSGALARVERAYLDGLEPLEPRLPADLVRRAERAIHLTLRPRLRHGADEAEIEAAFVAVDRAMADLDAALAGGTSFWFAAASSFAIIVREGLEAALLIAAILAWLARAADGRRHARQVWTGAALGVVASLGTWVAARTVIPVGGASRELVEGITALLAVAVLLYVSHWLFRKTYLHDWKEYLRERVGEAVTTGSSLAMAGLAFAVVYREGFETVLFYQALALDAGPGPVMAGFVPGALAIVAIGAGIIRVGLRLPLGRVFAVTNAILLYLAFVFVGKGLYALQEAGLFAPHPLAGVPDHPLAGQLLGIYPIAETLLAQLAFLAALGATWAWYWRSRRRRAAERAARASRGAAGIPGAEAAS